MSKTEHMHAALELATRGRRMAAPNPMVGCVIVKDDKLVSSGWHERDGAAHAEQQAIASLPPAGCTDASVYVTLEPCSFVGRTPSCAALLAAAQPAQVIVAMRDPDPRVAGSGIAMLNEAGIAIEEGLLAQQAAFLNRGYLSRLQLHRPYIRLKAAISLDGRISLPDGTSKWITSEQARRDVHELRACSCAIATGIGTALADDPELTARDVDAQRQPLRVLIDSKLRCRSDMKLFAPGDVIVFTAASGRADLPEHAEVVCIPDPEGKVDLAAAMSWLAENRKCNEVTFEAGGRMAGALLAADLVDEIVAYIAPKILGDGPAVAQFDAPLSIADAPHFALHSAEAIGPDIKAVFLRDGQSA